MPHVEVETSIVISAQLRDGRNMQLPVVLAEISGGWRLEES
jgi:hypothetical protein